MSRNLERLIASEIAAKFEIDAETITKQTNLEEIGVNSLELVELVIAIEDEYDISIDIDTTTAASSLKTVGDLVALGESLGLDKEAE